MGIFDKKAKAGGFMDEIRCDEPSYLIWKWHPVGSQPGSNNHENAIRWGSSLRVKDGEVAAFVYKQKDGTMQDFIVGPFDQTIKTANFPVLASIIGLAYDGGTPFQAEVYFINLAKVVQIKFAVPFFEVYDPRFLDFGVPTAIRGTLTFHISDYREFIKLHRLDNFNLDDFQRQVRDAIVRYVKGTVANAPLEYNIPVIQLERKIAEITEKVAPVLSERMKDTFGVNITGFDISAIEIDKTSDGYMQLKAVTQDIATATIQAETEAKIRNIQAKQRIEAEHYEGTLRIQREEGQYAQHKATQTANLGAFQIEKQAEVGVAGAEALGQMGTNGAGNVNIGGGDGFNMAGLMASMAVGGAVGQNIAGSMNNMMQGINQPVQSVLSPPPVPTTLFHVVINGQATGPFDQTALQGMVGAGNLTKDTLVWTNGMEQWAKAGTVDNLKSLFPVVPPIPPTEVK